MILEFKCSNHRSIKNEISFSMLTTSDDSHKDELYLFNGNNFNPVSAIYGANGSGKSNFINALRFLKMLVSTSIQNQPGDLIKHPVHKLEESSAPSKYSIQFVFKDIKYFYSVAILNGEVSEERLYHFPKGKQALIYQRKANDIEFGASFKDVLSPAQDSLKSNRLFLSCAANFSKCEQTENVFLFFRDYLVFYTNLSGKPSLWENFCVDTLSNHPEKKELLLNFMNSFGSDIYDIKAEVQLEDVQSLDMPEKLKDIFSNGKFRRNHVEMLHNKFSLNLKEESTGTQKLFEMWFPILDIIEKGKILIWDEIENSLHPLIVTEIIKLFKDKSISSCPQLIFSTHNTDILDLELFRRDQIWFTELMPEESSTDLYSLAEIKDVRKSENIHNGYFAGKYGALPIINKHFYELLGD